SDIVSRARNSSRVITAAKSGRICELCTMQSPKSRNRRTLIGRSAGSQQVGYCNSGDDPNNNNHDQELDQGESFLIAVDFVQHFLTGLAYSIRQLRFTKVV